MVAVVLFLGGVFGWLGFSVATNHAADSRGAHRTVAANVARDGFPPTRTPTPIPTPTPTPTPVPEVAKQCYGERRGDSAGFTILPASEKSVFANCQVIAYFGYPGVPGLGVLGQGTPSEMIARLKAQAAAYDDVNGPRGVVAALHLIFAVVQPDLYGSALYHMPEDLLKQQLALADENDLLVILDDQMGHSNVDTEFPLMLPYLDNPRVHLALDPEWTMPEGVMPATVIGGIDASEINRAQQLMSDYITAHHLANKMLIVHQFTPDMIRNKGSLQTYPGVDLVIDMDGFGGQEIKLSHYGQFVGADGAPHGGIKLFYNRDTPIMTPAEAAAIVPQPDFIVYE
jgi:hypothetical protein